MSHASHTLSMLIVFFAISANAAPLSISADGRMLASSRQGIVRILDVTTGEELRRFKLSNSNALNRFALSPDGKTLITSSVKEPENKSDGLVIWDTEKGTSRRIPPAPPGEDRAVNVMAFSSDSTQFAYACYCNLFYVLDLRQQNPLTTAWGFKRDGPSNVMSLDFSPNGKSLVAAIFNLAQIYDISKQERLGSLEDPQSRMNSAVFGVDGRTLLTASTGITLWDLESGKAKWNSSDKPLHFVILAFSPDRKTLARTGDSHAPDVNVFIYDDLSSLKNPRAIKHGATVDAITFTPDGKFIVTSTVDLEIAVWEVATGRFVRRLAEPLGRREGGLIVK